MSQESESLRADIRAGLIMCHCSRAGAVMENIDYHVAGCKWKNAVARIYELERAEDARGK